jgi:hypothetical protein
MGEKELRKPGFQKQPFTERHLGWICLEPLEPNVSGFGNSKEVAGWRR